MNIHCLTATQLWTYIQQPYWGGAMPCSHIRARSYLHNPRMEESDIVAVLAVDHDQIVGYRLLLPDLVHGVRFAWLSGVWVDPAYRRQGIAVRLLSVAREVWQDHLLLTNFVPASGAAARKGGLVLYTDLPGMRYYMRGDLTTRLGSRLPTSLRPIGQVSDRIINGVQGVRHRKWDQAPDPRFVEAEKFIDAYWDYSAPWRETELTQRDLQAWQHLLTYPWVTQAPAESEAVSFHFTTTAKQHRRDLVVSAGKEIQGVLLAMMTNGDARLAYQYIKPEHMQAWQTWLAQWLVQHRAASFTSFQPNWIHAFDSIRQLWWTRRPQYRRFLTTPYFLKQLPDPLSLSIQDGEGDRGFV